MRWSKERGEDVAQDAPPCVKNYNKHMGAVDSADQEMLVVAHYVLLAFPISPLSFGFLLRFF